MSISTAIVGALQFVVGSPILSAAILLFVAVFFIYKTLSRGQSSPNPLQHDSRRPPQPFVHDTRARDAVLKDRYKPAKVPDNLDAIIIGSGAGGLSAGVLLTKAGLRVLVLEQHDQAGGCCHSFVEKGFEFDTGIHYIGDLNEKSDIRVLLDQLTCGQLRWSKMDSAFDTVALKKSSNIKLYPMKSGNGDEYWQNLINFFPQEKSVILKYKKLAEDVSNSFVSLVMVKFLPRGLVRLLVSTGLIKLLFRLYRKGYAGRSLQEVLDELTDNTELKLVLSYIWGDYGVPPKDAPFCLHATIVVHYRLGAYYPTNGSSEIGFHMIQVIQKAGGKVLVQAPVSEIVCDSTGAAVGVRVGKTETVIRAKYIISDAGVVNTFKKLLPESVARKSEIYPLIKQVGQSLSFLSVFIGLEGSTSELKLPAGNIWLYGSENINKSVSTFLDLQQDDLDMIEVPFAFISFPSAKDPEWDKRFPGKSAALVCTLAKWDWFKEWKDDNVRHRGDRYEAIKDTLGRKMWQLCVDIYPQLDGRKVYMEVGTPVTNQYYLDCPQGEMYGLDHKVSRFSADAFSKLRADTDIKGLYLTGQDTLTCGFNPAVLSGLICASKILNRNLFGDLHRLAKTIHTSGSVTNGSVLKKKQ